MPPAAAAARARARSWLASLVLLPIAGGEVRRIIMLTHPRTGSSWTGGLLSDAFEGRHSDSTTQRRMLPLFEMFNQGFPFAMLNIYSSALNSAVKDFLAKTLVAPLLPANSTIRHQLEAKAGRLVALRTMGSSEYHKYTLGQVIMRSPQHALRIVARLATSWNASWLWFKVMHPASMPLSLSPHPPELGTSAKQSLTIHGIAPADVFMLLRRNVFQQIVSTYKLQAPGRRTRQLGDFQNFNTTSYRPSVPVNDVEKRIRSFLDVEEHYFAWANVSGDHEALLTQHAPLVVPSRGQSPGVLVLTYEQLLAQAEPGTLLASVLREVAGETVLNDSMPSEAAAQADGGGATQSWSKQDISSHFSDKVSNYDELQRWFNNQTTRARICAGAVRVACMSDPVYGLPW